MKGGGFLIMFTILMLLPAPLPSIISLPKTPIQLYL